MEKGRTATTRMIVCRVTWLQKVSAQASSNRGGNIAEEVMKVTGCTEGQGEHLIGLSYLYWHDGHPRPHYQSDAEPPIHDEAVAQGVTYGYVAVIGHGSQEKAFSASQHDQEIQLGSTAEKGDPAISRQESHQHFW